MSAAPLSAKHLAVITGGASGIGLAAAKTFVSRYGMNVAIGDVSDRLEGAVEDLRALSKDKEGGVRVWGGKVDVSSRESVQSFQKKVQEEFPESPLTFLMANAGVAGASKASEWSENWDRVFNINGFGVINTVQCFLPSIKAHKQPAYIVNTGSKQGITTPPMTGCAYNASKAVVKVFTEQLAWEMRNDESTKQIHPKLLIPGWVFTGEYGQVAESNNSIHG
jgi:NAD(P)-dependent dehydrogenase (short-subunit alcohol dehydrogenase family)